MKRILIVILAIAIGLFVGCSKQRGNESAASNGNASSTDTANAGTNANTSDANANANANGGNANLSSSDRDFVMKAAQGGKEEVELGQLAQQNGSSDEVKSFGQRMVNDHTQASDKLKQIAQQKGITLDESLPKDAQKDRDNLAKKTGKDFDKAYMAMMVKDHEKDVKDFQKEADKGQDPDIKAFASQTLPTLQDHLNMAKGSKNDVKKGKSNNNGANSSQPQ